jgi:hypothetical protein
MSLYSLGHSVLQHNHVLKPVLPDDEGESADGQPLPTRDLHLMLDNTSSRGNHLPMERHAGEDASATNPDEPSSEPIGEKPCHP